MIAALEGRQPDPVVPIWELHFHPWDQASGRHLLVGREFESLSAIEKESALRENAEIMVSVAEMLHFAAVTIPDPFWETAPGEPSYFWLPDDARYKLATLIKQLAGDALMVVASVGGVMGMPGPGNYVDFSYKLFDAPDEIDLIARRIYETGIDRACKMRDAGVEAVYTAGDLADNHGPFFNPEQMDRYVYPYLRKWVEKVKQLGLYAILHTDGNIYPILDEIVDSGVHALQAIDPVAKMDIRRVKTITEGKICLCGNVDCGLLFNGPAEVIYETTRDILIDCMPGGAFILGASNAVHRGTPIDHYLALTQAWQDYGYYA
jgi:uroporphyrinogen decarboxylase